MARQPDRADYPLAIRADYPAARAFFEESLAVRRATRDRWGIARTLNELSTVARLQGDYATAHALFQESVNIHRELRHEGSMTFGLVNLAQAQVASLAQVQAVDLFKEALGLGQQLGEYNTIAVSLAGLARIAAAQGLTPRAAVLLAAYEALVKSIGIFVQPDERVSVERLRQQLHADLGDERFEAEFAVGSGMKLEQAIAYALEESD